MIWFLEGQSSQREVLQGVREALPAAVRLYTSHRQLRPEITDIADIAWQEPSNDAERIAWVLEHARSHDIRVIVAGRAGLGYERHRADFEALGLDLVSGARSVETFLQIDDKAHFTAAAQGAGLACIPGCKAEDAIELRRLYEHFRDLGPVCVKPTHGIYGRGFWRLDEAVEPFKCFSSTDARLVHPDLFIQAYAASPAPQPLLVMPYLPGREWSVDMVCEAGRVIEAVGRCKAGLQQSFARDGAAVELARAAAEHFGCDGLINVQTRDDAEGVPQLLEINLRYSGGIGYTRHTGVNLAGIFATRRLGLEAPVSQWQAGVRVKPVTVAIPLEAGAATP